MRTQALQHRRPPRGMPHQQAHTGTETKHRACAWVYVRAAIRWLAFVNQSVIRQHAARHAATQMRVDNNRK
ncbi:hypothetical protein DF057_08455 [Burkholderia cepacia]|nr:hypothetical protein DF057_08455 [Burkholderia cepacia]